VRANERTDERVAQYFSLYSWLLLTIVHGENGEALFFPVQNYYFPFFVRLIIASLEFRPILIHNREDAMMGKEAVLTQMTMTTTLLLLRFRLEKTLVCN